MKEGLRALASQRYLLGLSMRLIMQAIADTLLKYCRTKIAGVDRLQLEFWPHQNLFKIKAIEH